MLRELARKIDAFQERFGQGVSWIMLLMVLVVFFDVIMRYAFNKSSVFTQELEWHLFGLVYLLGAGYTMLYNEHVRVDILYSRWSRRKKAWFDFLCYLRASFFDILPLRIWGTMTNFTLLAVPLFVFMGVALEKSGLAEELLETMALLFGKLKGGIAISVVVVGAILAASTGIVGASVITMGLIS